MKQRLLILGPLIKHGMPDVESWHKCTYGKTKVRDQETAHHYTNNTIKNQRKFKLMKHSTT